MKHYYLNFVNLLIGVFCLLFTLPSNSQTPEFWGMTQNGGESQSGIIFKTDENGNNQSVEFDFLKIDEAYPSNNKLCEASNGKLYGMTREGGENNVGGLFEFDPLTKVYTKKMDFSNALGAYPMGGLIEASNGKLYGNTERGGANGIGVLFEYNYTTNTYVKLSDFDGANMGSYPAGPLLQANDGKLYGTTVFGGANDNGALFEYNIDTNTFTTLFNFVEFVNGKSPYSGLIQASNGRLYGTASQGGIANVSSEGDGVLFEYIIETGNLTNKLSFDSLDHGWSPAGALLEADNGKLYGCTASGGTFGYGVLFEYNIDTDLLTKKVSFNETDYRSPTGSLIQLSNGKIYGTTSYGGSGSLSGTIYEFNPVTDEFIIKLELQPLSGTNPRAGLIQATNGKLYGSTTSGGTANEGVLFEYDLVTNSYTKELDFKGWRNGALPSGDLVLASNNKFYGLSRIGAGHNTGALFEFNPATGVLVKKVDLDEDAIGKNRDGNLIQAANGKFYGLSYKGSPNYDMVLYEYDLTTNTIVAILSDQGAAEGGEAHGSLLEASNGKLYGITSSGGNYSKGVLFEYDLSTNTYTKKNDFSGSDSGSYSLGNLIQSSNGKLYGLARLGGDNDVGTLFEYNIDADTFTKKQDFQGSDNGSKPLGSLVEAANGKLYGLTSEGGTYDLGVLFEYDIDTNSIIKKVDFDGANKGQTPRGSLIQGSNGKLYGLTYRGGVNSVGVMFEFDITTDTFTKKLDFDGANGYYPYASLIEINSSSLSTQDHINNLYDIDIYPNPVTNQLTIKNDLLIINKIDLYDMTGKSIQMIILKNDTVDVSHLTSGVYILRINTDKGNSYRRILKM